MKKVLLVTPLLFAMNSFSQNLIQNNMNFNQRFVQAPTQQVFASNMNVNDNNINKPVRANANPYVNNVQKASASNVTQRRQRRRVVPQTNINISNPIQVNTENVSNKNINDDVQLYVVNQMDNNVGNAFGNENLIEQLASVNIPAIQLGNGLDLNLDLNLPTLKLPSIKFNSRKSVSTSKHKSHTLKKKLAKLNRNLGGKLSFKKKLKIKVDNCFKW